MSTSRLQDLERRVASDPSDQRAAIDLALERRRQSLELLPDVPRRDFWGPWRRAQFVRRVSRYPGMFDHLATIDGALRDGLDVYVDRFGVVHIFDPVDPHGSPRTELYPT